MKDNLNIFRFSTVKKLRSFKDEGIIKILCGVRRAGKSTILKNYKEELISLGVKESNIVERLYTSIDCQNIDIKEMYDDLTKAISQADNSQKVYLLLDEVQEIDSWEKCVNSLFENWNVDIYVTGSNSKLLSSEISTYLTGRFVQIPVYTLSFSEFIKFKQTYIPSL